MSRLVAEIKETQLKKAVSEHTEKRKSLVGSGDRSEKIRTYNFPQNRLTDHRINFTAYNLDRVMEGDLDSIIEALIMHENTEKLKAGLSL